MEAAVVVRTDSDALSLLERLVGGEDIKLEDVTFEDWPRLELNVKGERYNSTITPELMKGFLELQTALNKSYALARYSASSRNLRDAEREDLKILVHVGEGSSEFFAKLYEQIDKVGDAFMQMESRDKLKGILGIGLLLFGAYAVDAYLDNKVELRKLDVEQIQHEAERNERLDTLNLIQRLSDAETERMRLMTEHIYDNYPEVSSMRGFVDEAYDKIFAGVADAESVTIQGNKIPGSAVSELATTKRQASTGEVVTGIYRIKGVDHDSKTHYKFKLRDVLRGEVFLASLPKDGAIVTGAIVQILKDAEWDNKVVMMKVLTKSNRGKITSAVIEKVTEITDQTPYEEQDEADTASDQEAESTES